MQKLISVFLFSTILTFNLAFAGTLDPSLSDSNHVAQVSSQGKVPVLIILKSQIDVNEVKKTVLKKMGPHQDLAANTFAELKNQTEATRRNFETVVERLRQNNQVDNVKGHWIVNAVSMNTTQETLQDLANNPDVEVVMLDELRNFLPEITVETPEKAAATGSLPWGLEFIKSPLANKAGFTGKGVEVHVLDTGIQADHPGFAQGQVLAQKSVSFVPNEDYKDRHGHGTHCAGTIGSKAYGVAPDVKLVAVRVLNKDGSGTFAGIIDGIEWSAANGADVVSMSLGGPARAGTDPLSIAIHNAIQGGVFFSVAAGNEGPSRGTIGTPGILPEVLTVGAIDSAGKLADFSSRGPTVNGDIKPDLSGPGVKVESLWIGSGTKTISGTSMATPHLAAVAALVIAKLKAAAQSAAISHGVSPEIAASLRPTPDKVKAILIAATSGKREENTFGAGIVDCEKALIAKQPTNETMSVRQRVLNILTKLNKMLG